MVGQKILSGMRGIQGFTVACVSQVYNTSQGKGSSQQAESSQGAEASSPEGVLVMGFFQQG